MAYGDGGIFLRNGIYYAVFYVRGREIRESLRTRNPDLAEKRAAALRRKRERRAYADPSQRRIKVDELLDDLLVQLELRGRASLPKARSHLKAVRLEIGHRPAHDLSTDSIEAMQQAWLRAEVAPATVNRRCELLREAYRLALRRTPPKVVQAPHVPLLPVQNARQGFLVADEAVRLLAGLREDDVRDFVEWLWWTGMRPNETRQLTWSMVDLEARVLTVAPQIAKTRLGRPIALAGPLDAIIRRRLAKRILGNELVFHRESWGRAGRPVRDFGKQWRAALVRAKLPLTLRPYDLRRSALRNLIRSGTHETVAMAISGHRTRSTFDRYNITSTDDVAAAIERVAKAAPGVSGRTKKR
jgi:integrase